MLSCLAVGSALQEACLRRIGFTAGCAVCFRRNIACDRRHCLGPCLKFLLRSNVESAKQAVSSVLRRWLPALAGPAPANDGGGADTVGASSHAGTGAGGGGGSDGVCRGGAGGSSWRQESLDSNPCLACDEARCGAEFMQCAGANRRRAGVVSDIERGRREVCTVAAYYLQQQQEQLGQGPAGQAPGVDHSVATEAAGVAAAADGACADDVQVAAAAA